MNMRPLTSVVGLLAIATVLSAQPGLAAQESVCQAYADQATRKLVKDAVQICGYSGPQWQASREQHLNWCRGASHEDVMSEQAKRNEWTDRCTGCYRYAKDAIRAQKKNSDLQCHFTGDAWSWDEQGHMNWCINNDLAAENLGEKLRPTLATTARNNDLKLCEGKAKACKDYAQDVKKAQRDIFLFACKGEEFTGARFGSGDHYGWCMAHDDVARANEQRARNNAVGQCRASFNPTQIQLCENYADAAVSAFRRASILASSCKVSGPRWHGNRDAHFAWCLGQFEGWRADHAGYQHVGLVVNAEHKAREADLQDCVGSKPINRDQRFQATPSVQGKPLSSKDGASNKVNQRNILEGGGLLDSNQGSVNQGRPSATGTPMGGAGGVVSSPLPTSPIGKGP
jgi:hypothetical protein